MYTLNSAETVVATDTPVAPLDGLVEMTERWLVPPPPVGVGVGVAAAMVVLNDASFPVDVPAEVYAAMR